MIKGKAEEIKKEETTEQENPRQQGARRLRIDERGIAVESCDYWLISGTPEEVVIRFGDSKGSGGGNPINITHKIVLNYYTAKRLQDALSQTVAKYDEALKSMNV